jgi:hypothetical protein
MQRFIHGENLKLFRDLLASDVDPAKRKQIERLVKEEEARELDPLPASPQSPA